jgi:hypothetical protein
MAVFYTVQQALFVLLFPTILEMTEFIRKNVEVMQWIGQIPQTFLHKWHIFCHYTNSASTWTNSVNLEWKSTFLQNFRTWEVH